MSSPNDGRGIDGNKTPQQTLLERKKEQFKKIKEAEEELWKIREEEMAMQESQQELDKEDMERIKSENAQLKQWQEELIRSLNEKTTHASECHREIERLEAELSCVKEKIAVCEREHEDAGDVIEMKEELEALRCRNIKHSASVKRVQDAMQRISSYSKTQYEERRRLMREVSCVNDRILALRQISAETQQREQNDIDSTSAPVNQQQQQQHTGKFVMTVYIVLTLYVMPSLHR